MLDIDILDHHITQSLKTWDECFSVMRIYADQVVGIGSVGHIYSADITRIVFSTFENSPDVAPFALDIANHCIQQWTWEDRKVWEYSIPPKKKTPSQTPTK